MFFSDKRNRFTCLNTLMLCAFFLMTGCGPASSSGEKSQEPSETAAQPAAESVAQATAPVTETLWDKRAEYENEGQVVLFTDCGLYKGDTDELTGAKCEFKDGKWVLLEPKLEPKDNLIKNGDFSEWSLGHGPFTKQGITADHFRAWNAGDTRDLIVKPYNTETTTFSPFSLFFESKTGGVELLQGIAYPGLSNSNKRKLTLAMDAKLLKVYSRSLSVGVIGYNGTDTYHKDKFLIDGHNIFQFGPLGNEVSSITLYLRLNNSGSFVVDNILIYSGILPMI